MFNTSSVCLRLRTDLSLKVQQIQQLDRERTNHQRSVTDAERMLQRDQTAGHYTGAATARLEYHRSQLAQIETQRRERFNEFDQLRLRYQQECGADYPLPPDIHR